MSHTHTPPTLKENTHTDKNKVPEAVSKRSKSRSDRGLWDEERWREGEQKSKKSERDIKEDIILEAKMEAGTAKEK